MSRVVLVSAVFVAVLSAGMAVSAAESEERDPLLYGLGSFFVPGLGQALQGELETGLVHFGVAVAIPTAGRYLALVSPAPGLVWTGVGLATLGWSVYSGVHSYRMAVAYNEAHGFGFGITVSFAPR